MMALICAPLVANADELTVNDGTTTDVYIPFYGFYGDYPQHTQFIQPAASLEDITPGSSISGIKFYSNYSAFSYTGSCTIRLMEVNGVTLSSALANVSAATLVYTGNVTIANNEFNVVFNDNYTYNGGDLLVSVQTTAGNYSSSGLVSWYGQTGTSGNSRYTYGSSGNSSSRFLPKALISYEPAATGSCARPAASAVIGELESTSATATWNAVDGVSQFQYALVAKGADVNWATATLTSDTTVAFTGLNPNTEYDFYLRSYCGAGDDEQSNPRKSSFRTACGAITSFPWFDGFENMPTGAISDPCWSVSWIDKRGLNTSTSTAPWSVSSSTAAAGTHSVYAMYTGSHSIAQLVLPEMNIPAAGAYEFKFDLNRPTGTSYLTDEIRVFVNATPDTIGATRLLGVHRVCSEAPAESEAGYYTYAVTIPNAGAQYIVLQYYSDNGIGAYLDNFQVREMPTCRPGTNFHFVSNTANSATFAWDAQNGETEWELKYRPYGSTAAYSEDNVSGTPEFELTGLEPNSRYTYDFIIRAVCGGVASPDSLMAKKVVFETECLLLEAENDTIHFNGIVSASNLTLKPCYNSFVAEGNRAWGGSTSYPHGTDGSASFYLTFSSPGVVLAMPLADIPENSELSFWLREGYSHYAYDSIKVFINDSASLTNATLIAKEAVLTTEYKFYRYDLSAYRGEKVLMIQGFTGSSGYLYLDDVIISPKPECLPFTDPEITAITSNSVSFAWVSPSEDNGFAYGYKLEGEEDWTEDMQEEGPYTLTVEDLEPATLYEGTLYLVALCDGGSSSSDTLFVPFSFTTNCNTISVANYSEGFESATADQVPLCWSAINDVPAAKFQVKSSSSDAHSGSKYLFIENTTSLSPWVASPRFEEELDGLRLSFWYRHENSTKSYGQLRVGTASSIADTTTFREITRLNATSTYAKATIDLNDIPADHHYIVFNWTKASTSYYYVRIDDVVLEPQPSCVAVRNLTVTDITTTSAKIQWTPGRSESEWEVTIKKGATELLKDTINVPYVVLDTLQPATKYSFNVLVKAVCDGQAATEYLPQATLTFTTDCNPLTVLPIAYGFETSEGFSTASNPTTNTLPACWNTEETYFPTGGTYPGRQWYVSTSAKHSGNNALCLPDKGSASSAAKTVLSFPAMELEVGKDYELVFWINRNGSADKLEGFRIFASHNSTLDETAVELGMATRNYTASTPLMATEAASGWYKYSVAIPMTGSVYLFFQGESYYGNATYVDDIEIREIASCQEVSSSSIQIQDGSVTTNGVTIVWTGSAPKYEVSLGTQKAIVNTPGTTLSGLNPATNYTANVQVRAICAEGDTSAWSEVKSLHFTTSCMPIATLPYGEDFENMTAGSSTQPNLLCWETLNTNSSTYVYVNTNTSYAKGTKSLFFSSSTNATAYEYAVLPEITADLSNAEIVFSYKMESATSSGHLNFGYITDLADLTTFVPLHECERINAWCDSTFALSAVPAGARLAFRYGNAGGSTSTQYYLGIDNIKIREIPTCFPGTGLHVVDSLITTTSAAFAWTPFSEDNLNAHVVIKNGDVVLADSIIADSLFVLEGLQASNAYKLNVYVYTVCGAIESTDAASGLFSFATDCEAIAALPFNVDFESFEGSKMPVCWTRTGNATYPYVSTSTAFAGKNSLYFYGGSSYYGDEIAVLPEFASSIDLNTVIFSAYFKSSYSSTSYPKPVIGTMSDPNNASTFVAQASLDLTTTFTQVELEFANVPADHHYVAIRVPVGSSTQSYYFDNISVAPQPTCSRPTDIAVEAIGLDSAVVVWTGNASQYELLVADALTVDTILVNDTCYVLRNLTSGHTYDYAVAVRGICAVGDTSKWAITSLSFNTECVPVSTFPWSTSFETAEGFSTSKNVGDVPCYFSEWSYLTSVTNPSSKAASISNTQKHTGSYSAYMMYAGSESKAVMALPAMDIPAANAYELRFWLYRPTGTSYLSDELRVWTNASTDTIGATKLLSLHRVVSESPAEGAAGWYQYSAILPEAGVQHVIFEYYSENGIGVYFDDVEVRLAPSCKKPANLAKVGQTDVSATFSWEAVGQENEWIVEVYSNDVRQDSVVVSSPNYSLVNLQPNTSYTYTISVKASCGVNEVSEALVRSFTFKTDKPADFVEALTVDHAFAPDFSDPAEQAKWDIVSGTGSNKLMLGTAAAALLNNATSAIYVSNNASAYYYSISSTSASAVARTIEVPANADTLIVEFDWLANGELSGSTNYDYGRALLVPGSMEVSVSSNDVKLGTSTLSATSTLPTGVKDLGGVLNNVTAAQHASTKLTGVAAGTYQIVFTWKNDGSGGAQSPLSVCNLTIAVAQEAVVTPQYTITVVAADEEQGTVAGAGTFDEGAEVEISATAATGFVFSQWSDGNTDNPRTVTVTADATYTAEFVADHGTGLDNLGAEDKAIKFVKDGHVYIMRNGIIYTATGQRVSK